jgi:hypothetical protein
MKVNKKKFIKITDQNIHLIFDRVKKFVQKHKNLKSYSEYPDSIWQSKIPCGNFQKIGGHAFPLITRSLEYHFDFNSKIELDEDFFNKERKFIRIVFSKSSAMLIEIGNWIKIGSSSITIIHKKFLSSTNVIDYWELSNEENVSKYKQEELLMENVFENEIEEEFEL